MIKHIFKLIWKKRKTTRLLLFEFFLSFILIFLVMSVLMWFVSNSSNPLGYKYDNVYGITTEAVENEQADTKIYSDTSIIEVLSNFNEVEFVSSQIHNHQFRLSFSYAHNCQYKKEKNFEPYFSGIDKDWDKIFKPNFVSGRAINSGDLAGRYCPVYVTKALREEMFGKRKAVGEIITVGEQEVVIIGVIDQFRYLGDYSSEVSAVLIFRTSNKAYPFKTAGMSNMSTNLSDNRIIYIRSKGRQDIAFEEKITKKLISEFPDYRFNIKSLHDVRKAYLKRTFVPIVVVSIIIGFLILNVLIGLFGQLWYSINQRKAEIGLRMALGASKGKVYSQLIIEMLVLTFIGLIPGIIVALQFPLLNVFGFNSSIYFYAIIESILILFSLVTLSSILPAQQASKLKPAIALHEE